MFGTQNSCVIPRGSRKRNIKDLKDKGENQFSRMLDPAEDHSSQQGWLEEADIGRKQVQTGKTATCSVWLLHDHSIGYFMLCSLLKYPKDMHAVRALAVGQEPFGDQTTLSQGHRSDIPAHQTFTLRLITIAQLQLWSTDEIILWSRVTRAWWTIKTSQYQDVENHWCRRKDKEEKFPRAQRTSSLQKKGSQVNSITNDEFLNLYPFR